MELALFVFLLWLAVASAAGWTSDSRDGADWHESNDGLRISRR
jgi:hypothetical protein